MSVTNYQDELALAVMDDDGYGCAITSTPAARKLPPWQPASNGNGKRIWFLIRGSGTESYRVPLRDRYHYSPSRKLIRYASSETAQCAADRLNTEEGA